MKFYAALRDLVSEDAQSKALFEQLPKAHQVMLQEQRQDICTYEELFQAAQALQKHSH